VRGYFHLRVVSLGQLGRMRANLDKKHSGGFSRLRATSPPSRHSTALGPVSSSRVASSSEGSAGTRHRPSLQINVIAISDSLGATLFLHSRHTQPVSVELDGTRGESLTGNANRNWQTL
jgi:hypothetical protein